MARILSTSAFYLLIIFSLTLSLFSMILVSAEDHEFEKSMDLKLLGLKKEKLTHFRMYWDEVVDGPNPSAITIVQPSNSSQTTFGLVRMFDNRLTLGPERSSKLLARAQGFFGSASQEDVSLLMAQNFAFIQGKYNGSTITLMGRNTVFDKVRELSVIGGSGRFRFARGYALLTTTSLNLSISPDSIVEYNIYVLHY
ncbi:PREDICTED: dirigent protein 19-like [Fragaria vesca subsp. vesca]|uniref:dirigent protein 19-like n=1 Tax=Fragaria vesca subsp. vesca TaxID=101020 RepID=UPI0002C35D59|nr:PREDICTED: dirigent protein 19-like [Fragaria vesca subsp. vesca]